MRISEGHTLLLDAQLLLRCRCLTVEEGLLRVAVSEATAGDPFDALGAEAVTLGFLRSGDQLPLDLLRRSWLHLEALTPVELVEAGPGSLAEGASSLTDWTVSLLLVRHLGDAEQRLLALLRLLSERLGHRCGPWVELPLRLTHGRIAELIGHNRVTVTRQLSKWRQAGLIAPDASAQGGLRLSARLLEPLPPAP
ncbi:MAG: helix-turn-helix domain-containing protein [Prochlorococcaceae cyanobacterium]